MDQDARGARGPFEEAIPFDGKIERPLMTLHGSGDLYVPISLEQSLRRAVEAAGKSSWLVQRIIRSPGHCNFSATEQAAAFDALVEWAHTGKRPEGDDVLTDLTNAGTRFTTPLRRRSRRDSFSRLSSKTQEAHIARRARPASFHVFRAWPRAVRGWPRIADRWTGR